jgi:hypothetical protein
MGFYQPQNQPPAQTYNPFHSRTQQKTPLQEKIHSGPNWKILEKTSYITKTGTTTNQTS